MREIEREIQREREREKERERDTDNHDFPLKLLFYAGYQTCVSGSLTRHLLSQTILVQAL